MNFNNIYREYLFQEAENNGNAANPNSPDSPNQDNSQGRHVNINSSDIDINQITDIVLTVQFADWLANLFAKNDKPSLKDFEVLVNAEWVINNNSKAMVESPSISNAEVLKYICYNESNINLLKNCRYVKAKVDAIKDVMSGLSDKTAPKIKLYSTPNKEDVAEYPISEEAITLIGKWAAKHISNNKYKNLGGFNKAIDIIASQGYIDKNIATIMKTGGKADFYNMSMILNNPLISKVAKDYKVKLDKANRDASDNLDKLTDNIEKYYRTLKIKEEYKDDNKALEELWEKYYNETQSISDNDARNKEIVKKLIDFIEHNYSTNKLLNDLYQESIGNTIVMASVISTVESMRYADEQYNRAPGDKTDKVKEMEDEFKAIKKEYDDLMKSKEARAVSKDNKAVHALLKTCGGLLTGAAFIIGGITKFAGKYIPGATLYTPYTAKLAKGLRTVGKLSYNAGSPLSAKSSKDVVKEITAEDKAKNEAKNDSKLELDMV